MRTGQSTVEYMLVAAVIVVAVVAAGWVFAPGWIESMTSLGERAETAYTDATITR
jgi:uncharacterized protein (UPF0333 family)